MARLVRGTADNHSDLELNTNDADNETQMAKGPDIIFSSLLLQLVLSNAW